MSTYGIKIGIAGKDVQDCTDEELIYYSENQVWNIYMEGTITLNGSGAGTVDHDLGYVPVFDAWVLSAGKISDSPTCGYVSPTQLKFDATAGAVVQYKIYTAEIHWN